MSSDVTMNHLTSGNHNIYITILICHFAEHYYMFQNSIAAFNVGAKDHLKALCCYIGSLCHPKIVFRKNNSINRYSAKI